jgi:hypothetical protein
MARKRDNKRSNQAAGLTPLEELAQAFTFESRPDGWYTISEIAVMFGISRQTAKRFCVTRGYECRQFRIHNNIPRQSCYRLT